MASVAERMGAKLAAALAPQHLAIVDVSARHAGHAGARPGGESHFRIEIVAAAFAGLSRIERHRLVNDILAAELREGVHALSLSLRSPDEAAGG